MAQTEALIELYLLCQLESLLTCWHRITLNISKWRTIISQRDASFWTRRIHQHFTFLITTNDDQSVYYPSASHSEDALSLSNVAPAIRVAIWKTKIYYKNSWKLKNLKKQCLFCFKLGVIVEKFIDSHISLILNSGQIMPANWLGPSPSCKLTFDLIW